jgi:hypothetical protein
MEMVDRGDGQLSTDDIFNFWNISTLLCSFGVPNAARLETFTRHRFRL